MSPRSVTSGPHVAPAPITRQVSRMTRRDSRPPGLLVEQLEDRLTPAGTTVPAGEFNWTQFAPTGELAQLVWEGQTLVYRTRVSNAWYEEPVATASTYSSAQY